MNHQLLFQTFQAESVMDKCSKQEYQCLPYIILSDPIFSSPVTLCPFFLSPLVYFVFNIILLPWHPSFAL